MREVEPWDRGREGGASCFSPGAVVSQVRCEYSAPVQTSWPVGVTGFNWLHLVSWNDQTVSKSSQGFTWDSHPVRSVWIIV